MLSIAFILICLLVCTLSGFSQTIRISPDNSRVNALQTALNAKASKSQLDSTANKLLHVSDTLGAAPLMTTKRATDSINALKGSISTVVNNLAANVASVVGQAFDISNRVKYIDTANMVSPYLRKVGFTAAAITALYGYTPANGANYYPVGNPSGYITSVPAQSYASLTGKPTIPTTTGELTNNSGYLTSVPAQTYASITGKPTLSTVAITGAYSDLTGAPAIPTTTSQLTNNSGFITTLPAQSYASITGKPVLATVATTGAYADLSGLPTIPTNNNQLANGAGFITTVSGTAGGDLSGSYPNPAIASITGTTNGTNAASGKVGEYISTLVPSASAVSLTSAAPANIASIALTAGDWDVQGSIVYVSTVASVAGKVSGTSTTSATLPADGTEVTSGLITTLLTGSDGTSIARKRMNITATTTVYLIGQCSFSAGAVKAYGTVNARRVR